MVLSATRLLSPSGSAPQPTPAPLVIAHRGATQWAPENSLLAFEAAIAAGADMVELDVRVTADNLLVVHHDSTARGLPVSLLSFEQLRERREMVTTLADALALCRGRISVDVEIKRAGLEAAVVELVERTLEPEQVVVTSFQEAVVAEVKRLRPALSCGLLMGPGLFRSRVRFRDDPFAWLDRCGADFVLPHQLMLPLGRLARASGRPGLLSRLAARGTPAVVWTVNRPDRLLAYLSDPRVQGVITDAPELATAVRAEATAARSAAVTGRIEPTFPSRVPPDSAP